MTSLLLGVSVIFQSLLNASLVCISEPFWYFKSIVYSLNVSNKVFSLVVGDSVLLLIIYSMVL